jgi:HAD superfamily hydrolase (TIGR01509 family)
MLWKTIFRNVINEDILLQEIMMTKRLPLGVIFDMDGVLVDSEPFICKAAMMMFAEHGLTVRPEDFLPFVGAGENRYIGGVAEKYNFSIDIERDKKRTYDIYLEIIKGELKPLPGVREFISQCRAIGLKLAVASSADVRKVQGNLTEVGLPLETFDAVVTGEDVVNKKPAPDIFIAAAKKLNLQPAECLVVEDAVNGIQAAKAAGARCLALATSFNEYQLNQADWIAANLSEAPATALNW